ncbi:hypothetical protein ACFPOU_08095 [Massilia jejuensis]|uniref:GIY-YIG domain-containing protein n=1 Tax=Massilia jejuensis TaxID=648894 RepID=A0ABW0PEK1_9BURK
MAIPNLNLAEFESIEMDFTGTACWASVPAVPGWYAIETDAPLDVLAKCPVPAAGGRHYLIAKRLQDAQFLMEQGAVIVPASEGALYIVYSGEHGDLKARAREHIRGSKGTGCLSLSQYEVAAAYRWTFYYRPCEVHVPGSAGNKTLRNYLEQKWRAENGWPILCSR